MFTPTITPTGLALKIGCRLLGNRAVALNDIQNAFRDMPAMHRVMNVLLNLSPGQLITQQDLNTAMSEPLTPCNRKTANHPNYLKHHPMEQTKIFAIFVCRFNFNGKTGSRSACWNSGRPTKQVLFQMPFSCPSTN